MAKKKFTYVWECCYCGSKVIPYRTTSCPSCKYARCGNCLASKNTIDRAPPALERLSNNLKVRQPKWTQRSLREVALEKAKSIISRPRALFESHESVEIRSNVHNESSLSSRYTPEQDEQHEAAHNGSENSPIAELDQNVSIASLITPDTDTSEQDEQHKAAHNGSEKSPVAEIDQNVSIASLITPDTDTSEHFLIDELLEQGQTMHFSKNEFDRLGEDKLDAQSLAPNSSKTASIIETIKDFNQTPSILSQGRTSTVQSHDAQNTTPKSFLSGLTGQPANHMMDYESRKHLSEDDDESILSSYANSVFSIASMASSTTDLSLHSNYSPTQILKATEELIVILRDDQLLVPLYKSGIADPSIGPGRLQRNLRRLFKSFAESLTEEAGDTFQFQISQLVSVKANDVARSIVEKFHVEPENILPSKNGKAQDCSLEDSDDELEAQPVNEEMFRDLGQFRDFLKNSYAILELHAQIRSFVLPKSLLLEMKPSPNVQGPPESEQHVASIPHNLSFDAKILDFFLRGVVGYLEPPLAPGYTRLRWECRCGDVLFGDVLEYHEGGVAKMVDRMQHSMGVVVTATPYSSNTSNQKYTLRVPTWSRNMFQRVAAAFGHSSNPATPCLPKHNSCRTAANNGNQSTPPVPHKTLHLMACMQRGRYRRTLHQQHIEDIKNDRALFCVMRSQAAKCHRFVWRFLSLKCIQGLYFVKFRLRACGSAEVREHFPCCTSSPLKPCECLPPASKVEPEPGAEYRCTPPGPLDVWPPILSQELMHMLTSPNCIHEDQTFVLEQLPKRTKGELKGSAAQPVEGWGIYYEEGWNIDLIFGIVLVIFLLASLLFGILWSCLKLDIQGAFGVSSYMVTASGIFIAWIANRAGKLE